MPDALLPHFKVGLPVAISAKMFALEPAFAKDDG